MRARIGLAGILCGFLLGGCGSDSPFRPDRLVRDGPKAVAVELDLELSSRNGSAGSPITVQATARNVGQANVHGSLASGYCACDGLVIEILGPDGQRVWMVDPCLPQPVCLCAISTLEPGKTLPRSLPFEGAMHRFVSVSPPECAQEQAASGEYTAVARYAYHTDEDYSVRMLEKRVTFHWTGP